MRASATLSTFALISFSMAITSLFISRNSAAKAPTSPLNAAPAAPPPPPCDGGSGAGVRRAGAAFALASGGAAGLAPCGVLSRKAASIAIYREGLGSRLGSRLGSGLGVILGVRV